MLRQRNEDLEAGMDHQQEELDLLRQRCEDLEDDNAGLRQKCEDFRGYQQQYQADHEALQQGEVWLTQGRQQLEGGRANLRQGEASLAQERQQFEEEHVQRSQRLEKEHMQRSQRLEEEHMQRSRQLEEEHAARTMKFFSMIKVKLNELFVGVNTAMPGFARSSAGSEVASEHDGNVTSPSALTPEDVTQGGDSPVRGIKRSASDAGASPIPEVRTHTFRARCTANSVHRDCSVLVCPDRHLRHLNRKESQSPPILATTPSSEREARSHRP